MRWAAFSLTAQLVTGILVIALPLLGLVIWLRGREHAAPRPSASMWHEPMALATAGRPLALPAAGRIEPHLRSERAPGPRRHRDVPLRELLKRADAAI